MVKNYFDKKKLYSISEIPEIIHLKDPFYCQTFQLGLGNLFREFPDEYADVKLGHDRVKLLKMFEEQVDCDAYLSVSMEGTGLDGRKAIGVHKIQLASISGYFKRFFVTDRTCYIDVDHRLVQTILRYIYTGSCDVESIEDLMTLCVLADEWDIQSLHLIGLDALHSFLSPMAGWHYITRQKWSNALFEMFIGCMLKCDHITFFDNMTPSICVTLLNEGLDCTHRNQIESLMIQYLYIHGGLHKLMEGKAWQDLELNSLVWIFSPENVWDIQYYFGPEFEYSMSMNDTKWIQNGVSKEAGKYYPVYVNPEDKYGGTLTFRGHWKLFRPDSNSYFLSFRQEFAHSLHPCLNNDNACKAPRKKIDKCITASCYICIKLKQFELAMYRWTKKYFDKSPTDVSNVLADHFKSMGLDTSSPCQIAGRNIKSSDIQNAEPST